MKDFQLSKHNIDELFSILSNELNESPVIVVSSQDAGTGKWGMSRLWYMWMSQTAEWMVERGAKMPLFLNPDGTYRATRLFNEDDAHELFTSKYLFLDAYGTRLSWARKAHNGMRPATKAERWLAMLKHDQWATEKGILLFHPRDSEYQQLTDEQNK
jgi:hypothetical protein